MADSVFVNHTACPQCRDKGGDRSGDNLAIYDDGHGYCHKCSTYFESNEMSLQRDNHFKQHKFEVKNVDFVGRITAIAERGLTEQSTRLLQLATGTYNNKEAYGYLYNNGVKIRYKDEKKFLWVEGKAANCCMYGLDKAVDYTNPIIITEGEFDAAACVEVGYQACSLKCGSGSVEKDIKQDINELLKYKEIWLGFDNDEAGQEATNKAVKLLPKAKVIDWIHYKDANEVLINNDGVSLESVLNNMLDIKPDGIVFGNELNFNNLQNTVIKSIEIPAPKLQQSFGGFDYGCLYLVLAGVGIGKSTLLSEWGLYFYEQLGLKVANLFYEENEDVTPLRYIALKENIPIGKLRRNRDLISNKRWEELQNGFLNSDKLVFLSKNSLKNSDSLLGQIEYLVTAKGFDVIIIDHISYIIGRSGVSKNGERRDIDELIYKLQDLTQRLGCIIIAVSHITESKKEKGWDEGEVPDIYSGRGSKVLAQVPDGIIALARNMKNEWNQSIINLYNCKNRWGGKLGKMDSYVYYDDTGRLKLYD